MGDLATLRRALRGAGAEYKIYKNTLVRRATADTPHAAMDTMLVGPTAIAFIDKDVAAAAKVLREFAKTHPALVVKGSFVGSGVLDARTTNALADLPSREVLLGPDRRRSRRPDAAVRWPAEGVAAEPRLRYLRT